MSTFSSKDLLVVLRAASIVFTVIAVRSTLIQAGLSLRLVSAIAAGRTKWPGPLTLFVSRAETRAAMLRGKRPPRLYSRYLANAVMLVASCGLLISTAWTVSTRLPPGPTLKGFAFMLIVGGIANFVAYRRTSRYDEEVEWALGQSPRTPGSTEEADREVVPGYTTARAAIRRIWSQLWLVALSGVFIWNVVENRDGALAREALAHPQDGPILRQHAEAAERGERSFYFKDSKGTIGPLEEPRALAGNSLGTLTTADGTSLIATFLKRRTVDDWRSREVLPLVLYKPRYTLFYPELDDGRPRVMAMVGEPQDLADFAKGRGVMGIIFSVVYVGFSINALYIITSLRRLVRVTFARKGRPRE